MADPVLPIEAGPAPAEPVSRATPESGARSLPLGVPAALDTSAPRESCANCGAPLLGRFCAQCGQRAESRVVSLRYILQDALEDQLSLNAALPRTAAALLRHPGRLTVEYVRGRVARYIPPMRLYLGASVLYFLLYAVVPRPYEHLVRETRTAQPSRGARIELSAGPTTNPQGGSAVKLTLGDSSVPGWLRPTAERLRTQIERLKAMDQARASQLIIAGVAGAAPKVVFLMLPIFALLLKLLYVRRHRLYVEHFVFALHVHALAFLVFIPLLFLRHNWLSTLVYGVIGIYVLLAMRAVYGQGWGRTALKFALLATSYMVVIGIGIGAALLIALLSI